MPPRRRLFARWLSDCPLQINIQERGVGRIFSSRRFWRRGRMTTGAAILTDGFDIIRYHCFDADIIFYFRFSTGDGFEGAVAYFAIQTTACSARHSRLSPFDERLPPPPGAAFRLSTHFRFARVIGGRGSLVLIARFSGMASAPAAWLRPFFPLSFTLSAFRLSWRRGFLSAGQRRRPRFLYILSLLSRFYRGFILFPPFFSCFRRLFSSLCQSDMPLRPVIHYLAAPASFCIIDSRQAVLFSVFQIRWRHLSLSRSRGSFSFCR